MIKTFFTLAMAITLLFSLTGCGPIYKTTYTYISPKSWNGRQCANQCLQNQTNCNMQCNNQYQSCLNSARIAATPTYLAYLAQKTDEDKTPRKTLDDFVDPLSCNQNCDYCHDTYNQCFANCGGQVIANRQCVAFCS